MKKLFLTLSIALATLSASAIDWNVAEDLVPKGASVIVSSNAGEAANITDKNNGNRWQAKPSTHNFTKDWIIIDLGEEKTFTDVEIMWESSHASLYHVYTSNTLPKYTEESLEDGTPYNLLAEGWQNEMNLFGTGGNADNGNYTETVVGQASSTSQYIMIYCEEYCPNGNAYGVSIFEVRAANITDKGTAAVIKISANDLLVGTSGQVTLTAFNAGGELIPLDSNPIKDISLKCSDPEAISIVPGEQVGIFNIEGLKIGLFTLTATALNENDETLTAELPIQVLIDWNSTENLAEGKAIMARWKDEETAEDNTHPFNFATDGDLDSYYTFNGGWGGGDSWVIVDLGEEYVVNAISTFFGNNSTGLYRVAYAPESNVDLPADDIDKAWNGLGLQGWSASGSISRSPNTQNDYVFDTPVVARYIAVFDADNPGGKPQYREICVKGIKYDSPEFSDINISINQELPLKGETIDFIVKTLDQFGAEIAVDEVPEITIIEGEAKYENGKLTLNSLGTIKVKAELDGLTSNVLEIMTVADVDDYIMGDATITSDNPNANPAAAVDGGKMPNQTNGEYIIAPAEPKGANEHWLIAEFGHAYDLDMIIAIWEGAAPSNYDVFVGDSEDNLIKVYTVTGHDQRTWFDRLYGQEMKNVRFIKIETHENATGYGIKLLDLKAYGKVLPSTPDAPALDEVSSNQTQVVVKANKNHNLWYKVGIYDPTTNAQSIVTYAASDVLQGYTKAETTDDENLDTIESDDTHTTYTFNVNNMLSAAGLNSLDDLKPGQRLSLSVYSEDPITDTLSDEMLIGVDSEKTTGVEEVAVDSVAARVDVYNLQGVRVRSNVSAQDALNNLPNGIYIVGGKKVIKK